MMEAFTSYMDPYLGLLIVSNYAQERGYTGIHPIIEQLSRDAQSC